ncbi:clavaminate synthase family protein [Yinghuangia aomiensis]|uniref:Clavaminate synthase family protein n=1 Tax=Yinghuangia aomiensis TaxID=676205 RepID=A0ABP9I7Q9_9ACTN
MTLTPLLTARAAALLRPDDAVVVHVDRPGQVALFALARSLDPGDEAPDEAARRDWAEHGAAMSAALPADVHRAVARYRGRGAPAEALLLRAVLAGLPKLVPTPTTLTPTAVGADAQRGALALLGVASLLGEPFGFRSLYGGRLVQHVLPVRTHHAAQTSGDSTDLLWHVEDAHRPDRCHYLALLCLRGAPDAATVFASARAIQDRVGDRWGRILREPRFAVRPDSAHLTDGAHDGPQSAAAAPVAVLSGPVDDPEIRFDAVYLRPHDPGDDEAAEALRSASEAAGAAAVGHVLEPGDLLVLDNRRAVHGRTLFRPRYDGTDRWLLRAMVCADLAEHRRRRGLRALT